MQAQHNTRWEDVLNHERGKSQASQVHGAAASKVLRGQIPLRMRVLINSDLAGGFKNEADLIAFAKGNAIARTQPVTVANREGQPIDVGSIGAANIF